MITLMKTRCIQHYSDLFADDVPDTLQNIMSKDIATLEIQQSLLTAKECGQTQVDEFLNQRLLPTDERKVKFSDPLHKNKALTFASLYEVISSAHSRNEKKKILKADRSILQRLIMAYEARTVNLHNILKRELLPVPL